MVNQLQFEGAWRELRGRVRSAWAELTDQDLDSFRGNVDQLVGLIERRTGDAREDIEARLEELLEQHSSTLAGLSDSARTAMSATEDFVQSRPAESLAIVFGTGLLLGVVVGMMSATRRMFA